MEALKLGESTSLGTGMIISTLLAMDLDLNWLFAYMTKHTAELIKKHR